MLLYQCPILYEQRSQRYMDLMKSGINDVILRKLVKREIRAAIYVTQDSYSSTRCESLFKQSFDISQLGIPHSSLNPAYGIRKRSRVFLLARLTVRPPTKRGLDFRLGGSLGGNRPGAYVLRNFYYSADPNTGRGKSTASVPAYRERERDSDSERRNVTRRACFAVVAGRFWISLNQAESRTRARGTKDR